ncbi:MAG: helix-turn-helix domain-containing protein [Bdellovibrionales bacterium]|nr:helix-turn-helix domain-containing protein [Bdellovibrionales bacterium]
MINDRAEVMTTDDVVNYLKVSRKTLLKLVRNGEIPARKVGKNYRYLRKELEKYLLSDDSVNYFEH